LKVDLVQPGEPWRESREHNGGGLATERNRGRAGRDLIQRAVGGVIATGRAGWNGGADSAETGEKEN